MAAARRHGVSYDQIMEEFGVVKRTALRMVEALQDVFDVERHEDDERRARFRIPPAAVFDIPQKPDTTLEALDLALRGMDSVTAHAAALRDLRDGILARMDQDKARRALAEAETFLQVYGHVATFGPRTRKDPEVLEAISAALRGPFVMSMYYGRDETPRLVQPYGILQGVRGYLVARQPEKGPELRKYRLDLIREASCGNETFVLDEDFDIEAYAAESFGVWHDPKQLAEVVWRFLPEVAERAAEFVFHPKQVVEKAPDGSLIVRFTTSGWNEMTWYLYQWGDKVEVLAPPELAAMVEGYQRSDINALP